jgi:serine protease Do
MAERAPDAQQQGVLVREVEPASPAFQAGIKNGDLINKVDNRDVRDFDALLNALSQHKAGDKVNLQVLRDGKTQSFDVTLGQRQARRAEEQGARQPTAFLGVQAQELTPEMKKQLGINVDKGVLITSVMPGTPAANAGLRQGDVITSVNDQQIQDPQQLRDAIHQAGVGKEVGLKAMRGQNSMDFKARLEEAPVDFFTPPARP